MDIQGKKGKFKKRKKRKIFDKICFFQIMFNKF